ncbi:MAG TPA: hypothetical protein VMZ92_14030 [Planctomycetota bacterium]|nr:hypothetical protein [Planctomycetota bacterium]
MEGDEQEAPAWQGRLTALVFILAVTAFAYIAYAYYTQRSFGRLMTDLISPEEDVSSRAADELASSDDALPYLTNVLVHARAPERRVLCATVILRRVETRRRDAGSFSTVEQEQEALRSGLNMEAVTAALGDESLVVRTKAREIVALVGLNQTYQKTRLEDVLKFEELLRKLAEGTPAARDEAGEQLRETGVRALPYLVGVVFSDDGAFRLRGLNILRTVVQDVLRGSNQRRIVTLLGRRRCRLLLRETIRLAEADRSVITDILNVSGRVPEAFFPRFLEDYAAVTDEEARYELLTGQIDLLEEVEKVRATGEELTERIKKLHDATGRKP